MKVRGSAGTFSPGYPSILAGGEKAADLTECLGSRYYAVIRKLNYTKDSWEYITKHLKFVTGLKQLIFVHEYYNY